MNDENKAKGSEFLRNDVGHVAIFITDSDLQYQVLKNGAANRPKSTEIVKVNYFGALIDETKFDSSYSHNKFTNSWLNQGIKG